MLASRFPSCYHVPIMRKHPKLPALTRKQETFARSVALDGLNLSDAYRSAYNTANFLPKTVSEEASRLASNPKVAAMIQSLKASFQRAEVETRVWDRVRLVQELEKNVSGARAELQFAPSTRALELIGKVTGLLADTPSLPQSSIQIVFVVGGKATPGIVEGEKLDKLTPTEGVPGPELYLGVGGGSEAPQSPP